MNVAIIAVIALIIIVAFIFAWYHWPSSWQTASFKLNDTVTIPIPAGKDMYNLKFKKCYFTTNGVVSEVSGTLNNITGAYSKLQNSSYKMTPATAFVLPAPLNPFSFTINGVNDPATVPDPTASPWCSSPPASCTVGNVPSQAAGMPPCNCMGIFHSTASANAAQANPLPATPTSCVDAATDPIGGTTSDPTAPTGTPYNYPICVAGNSPGNPTANARWMYAYKVPGKCQVCPTNMVVTLTVMYRYV